VTPAAGRRGASALPPAVTPAPQPSSVPPTAPILGAASTRDTILPDPRAEPADESARALERALVREGGLVLPQGSWEIDSQLRYAYHSFIGLRVVDVGGQAQIAAIDERRDRTDLSVGLRRGLPWSSQLELRVPYVIDRRSTAAAGAALPSDTASGLGDVDVSLTKQFVSERPGMPGVLGSLTYRADTGDAGTLGRLSAGSGYGSLQASSTLVKRLDPMVFFGTLSYAWPRSLDDGSVRVDPGNVVGLRLSTALAASPETSMRFGLELQRAQRARLHGAELPGSEATLGLLELGVSTLLTPRTLLSVQLGVGLTSDSPDFQLTVALPVRF
jgi:hypothetical protein